MTAPGRLCTGCTELPGQTDLLDQWVCDTLGHVWTEWRDCGCGCHRGEPRIPTHTQPWHARSCDNCHEWEWREPT